jgi:predicted nucleic acid-binding protein
MQMLIVDTDVVSYLFKKDTRAALYEPHLANRLLYISFMTTAELERWPIIHRWGEKRRQQLREFLKDFAMITPDETMCRTWAQVYEQVRQSGKQIGISDAWVAATAVRYDVPLVTNNRKDFAAVNGLTIISEAPQ